MTVVTLGLFVVFSLTSTLVPGPNALVVVRSALAGGRFASELTVLGVCLGHCVWGALAIFGIVSLMQGSPLLMTTLKLVGAAYILWMGLQLLLPKQSDKSGAGNPDSPPPPGSGSPFTQGLMASLLNPNTGLFFLALFPQFLGSDNDSVVLGLALVTMHIGFASGWYSLVGQLAGRGNTGDRNAARGYLFKSAGIAMVSFGYMFAWTA